MANFGNENVLANDQKLEEQKSGVQVQAGEDILNFIDYSGRQVGFSGTKSEDNSYHCTIDCLSINVR